MIIVILGWSLDDDVFDRFRGARILKQKKTTIIIQVWRGTNTVTSG